MRPAYSLLGNQFVLALALVFICSGIVMLGVISALESHQLAAEPWTDALVTPDAVLETQGAISVRARRLPIERKEDDPLNIILSQLEGTEGLEGAVEALQPEHVLAVDLPVHELAPLLAEGRLPDPGKREALAGVLARFPRFTLDGETFEVVGRLKPTVSGFIFAYLLPLTPEVAPYFAEEHGATRGSLLLDGLPRFDELFPESMDEKEVPDALGGQLLTKPAYAWTSFWALLLVACGSVLAHRRLFRAWVHGAPEVFRDILRETVRAKRLFLGMHLLLYGVFFGSILAGMSQPLLNYWMTHFIGSTFREGGLRYIGDAYASGNIALAALATFYNNYVVQTLLFTFAISVLGVPLGVIKTALSFLTVGFVMAPIWAGAASGMTFHCITMALELEAYIVACFAVTLWPLRVLRAIVGNDTRREFLAAVRMFVGAMVLSGVMLALAALYEATTIILLRPLL
ncbi:MAG: stage II sporulation protein M [Candidatus Hydrogenedentes bacterium]|nr:stage II sporulation protein M [Candidatus Hydrogenedentota bacterium]